VLSGDTVILVGKAVGSGPPQEITITLASLQAPRISRGPQQSVEDASAWESREFLRKLCIGKTVTFKIVYCVISINRTFGDIYFPNTSDDPEAQPVCLSELVVAAGWAPVRGSEGPSTGSDKLSSRHDTLLALETDAKAAGRGMHGAKGPARSICWAPTSTEVEDIFNKYKGVPTTVVVVSEKRCFISHSR
jgi:staphylococcal nuclease domain-containing protein 1